MPPRLEASRRVAGADSRGGRSLGVHSFGREARSPGPVGSPALLLGAPVWREVSSARGLTQSRAGWRPGIGQNRC